MVLPGARFQARDDLAATRTAHADTLLSLESTHSDTIRDLETKHASSILLLHEDARREREQHAEVLQQVVLALFFDSTSRCEA
jgi:hypothetical protein